MTRTNLCHQGDLTFHRAHVCSINTEASKPQICLTEICNFQAIKGAVMGSGARQYQCVQTPRLLVAKFSPYPPDRMFCLRFLGS